MGTDRKKRVTDTGVFTQVIQSFFPEAQKTDKEQILVHCPFHQDENPSLSVNSVSGLFNCFACGAKGNGFDLYMKVKSVDFKTALNDLEEIAGIDGKEVSTVKVFPQVVATYFYHDEKGNKRYWKKRYEPGFDGKRSKSFAFYHENKGKERKGRGGDPLLYNMHLLADSSKDDLVFVVEGEAKADLLASWDLVATSLDSGGQSGKGSSWRDRFRKYFKNREVIILPDNDKTGEKYAQNIIDQIFSVAKVVKILRLPELPPKGDIIDWVNMRGGYEA